MTGAQRTRLGTPRLHLRRTDSTNERARDLAVAGAPSGTLVSAAEQTAGRGRQGRSWSAPPGSALLASIVLREPPRLLPLIAGVAACEALQLGGTEALIKWPNDIVLLRDGQLAKLAGILVEARPQEGWAVLGIGVNVAVAVEQLPAEVRARAATLGAERGEIERLLERLLVALERGLRAPAASVLAAWAQRDALSGREVAWGSTGGSGEEGRGVAAGIDGEGRLVIALADGGRTALGAGEVHLLDGGHPPARAAARDGGVG